MTDFVIKGNICCSVSPNEMILKENAYVVCVNGKSAGVFEELPMEYRELPLQDHTGCIVMPGLVDLHLHAPQYTFRGQAMDLELIDWLNTYTFKEEARYADPDYADEAYDIFVDELTRSATTRACMFGTIHKEATLLLMEKLEKAGMCAYVGKVNMDRNSPDYLCEESADQSAKDTEDWILEAQKFAHVKPILTPRFTPSCTDELFEKLAVLQKKYHLPMQSHLSENPLEIAWVKELCPGTKNYGDSYDRFGLFGGECPTIMAHCVHSGEEEVQRMLEQGVFVAHCPESNANLSSGIAPAKYYLDKGLRIGLGSDIAGGTILSIFRAMAMAVQCSKLRWRLVDPATAALTVENVFYMATMGGGAFFGKVGSFMEGYAFDALVIDDAAIRHPQPMNLKERLERVIYLSDERQIKSKYVDGRKLW